MKLQIRRSVKWVALFGCLMLSVPGVSGADEDARTGVSMVSEVDVARRRVTIDEEVYRLNDGTRIQRFNGVPATLAEIRVPRRTRNELVPVEDVDYVRFEAKRIRDRWFLESLTILEEPVR